MSVLSLSVDNGALPVLLSKFGHFLVILGLENLCRVFVTVGFFWHHNNFVTGPILETMMDDPLGDAKKDQKDHMVTSARQNNGKTQVTCPSDVND